MMFLFLTHTHMKTCLTAALQTECGDHTHERAPVMPTTYTYTFAHKSGLDGAYQMGFAVALSCILLSMGSAMSKAM